MVRLIPAAARIGVPALNVDASVVPSLAIAKPGDRARFVKGGDFRLSK